jgi:hypothetical protein
MLVDEIKACIEEMRITEFVYKGSWRTVEPYLLGITTKGKLCLSAFQIAGGSGTAWRAFLVEGISNFTTSEGHFDGLRSGYNPNDSTMQRIIASV